MQRDALYVADLVESSRTVRGYLDGISRERWDEDQVLRDAVLYRMLLLGEIASALPDSLRDRYPDVDWRHIRAFRNLAVHKYFSVDWAVVWQIAQEEVPVLEEQAMGILRAEFPDVAKTYEPENPADVEPGLGDSRLPSSPRSRPVCSSRSEMHYRPCGAGTQALWALPLLPFRCAGGSERRRLLGRSTPDS
jgi:uncharacterized protein with HEPN domain